MGSRDPLVGVGVVEGVLGAVEQHFKALHAGLFATCTARVDVHGDDVGHLFLDGARSRKQVIPALRLPVSGQSCLLKDLLVVVDTASIGAEGNAVDLAVEALCALNRAFGVLAPLVPVLDVVVDRGQVSGCGIAHDLEGVFVDDVGSLGLRLIHQRKLGHVLICLRFNGLKIDGDVLVSGLELFLCALHEVFNLREGRGLVIGDNQRLSF